VIYQKHTQFVRDPATCGPALLADYALRTIAALGATLAVLALRRRFFEINPVGDYGPYRPWIVMNGAVPTGMPRFSKIATARTGDGVRIAGHPIPPVFWPGSCYRR